MSRIVYATTLEGITPARLGGGFFAGWPQAPTPSQHLLLLRGSDLRVLALDGAAGPVVGFVTALTDGVLSAFIPLLEVLPAHRGQGIGSELMRRMLDALSPYANADLLCDPELQPFYRRFGLEPAGGMVRRDRAAIRRLSPAEAEARG